MLSYCSKTMEGQQAAPEEPATARGDRIPEFVAWLYADTEMRTINTSDFVCWFLQYLANALRVYIERRLRPVDKMQYFINITCPTPCSTSIQACSVCAHTLVRARVRVSSVVVVALSHAK